MFICVFFVAVHISCVVSVGCSSERNMPSLLKSYNSNELSAENLNNLEFGGQELILKRAAKLKQELSSGVVKPFRDIIEANLEDNSVYEEKQMTFIRQVTAIACLPDLLQNSTFPEDAKNRARTLLRHCQGNSIGSLTNIEGLGLVRGHIAGYIQSRDKCPANGEDIIIVPGISTAVKILYKFMNYTSNGQSVGVLTPVPECPIFAEVLTQFGIEKVGYYLNEDSHWSIDVPDLERAMLEGTTQCCLRAILVINPGNPTGQVLTRENMEEIIKFASRENLLIIACEVYQDNVYGAVFKSFKKVVFEMAAPYNHTELVSLMSSPKGYAGESGMRAGYMELYNLNPSLKELIRSSIQIADSPPICAQIALDCMACPPVPGQPSYSLFQQERTSFLNSLEKRARRMCKAINHIPGLSCHALQGGFFAFVKVNVPETAVEMASHMNQCPSTFYVLEMLEHSGVLTIPGEGFGQKPGSYHFRISILLPEEVLKDTLQRIQNFHFDFIKRYT